MFGSKKTPQKRQNNGGGFDASLKKLAGLSATIHMAIAGAGCLYAGMAIFVNHANGVGAGSLIIAAIFALLGFNALNREVKTHKLIAKYKTCDDLRSITTPHFERYLTALLSMEGYNVRSAIDELHRQDDADLIATRKKEMLLVQFNHWDEPTVGMRALQSLHKAATIFRATGCVAVTLGRYQQDAKEWASRKGMRLLTGEDLLGMGAKCTGTIAPARLEEQNMPPCEAAGVQKPYLFVDFGGISICDHLERFIEQCGQRVAIVATTLPDAMSLEDFASSKPEIGKLVETLLPDTELGRYFSIMDYLRSQSAAIPLWCAVDTLPQQYPEGCTEIVLVGSGERVQRMHIDTIQRKLRLTTE